ncbi:T9SS type A sorting domain-containing protein [Cytophagales bacterium LB-30]|uniref:T9SS type A sorting domain-containing protein n=1 Tax=Shiella aurantiaca TaxID=3058365 RepID=A0ABT8F4A7_9BACT|nr:leucine-rich repeat domain-containing protein [Shiella aurantiaca]MDN4165297.1 T9SS type A sorting domain-containing protein [Shiella aurantiaca]
MKISLRLLLFISSLFITTSLFAQNTYYWVGGSGNWSDFANHWATTSGGTSFHAQVPSALDSVVFDTNSFLSGTDTVFIDVPTAFAANLDMTDAANSTPTLLASPSNGSFTLSGSLILPNGVSWRFNSLIFNSGLVGNRLNFGSEAAGFANYIQFNNPNGEWTLESNIGFGNMELFAGNLNISGRILAGNSFNFRSTDTKTFNADNASISVTNWNSISDFTGLSFSAANSFIRTSNFIGGGLTYNTVQIFGFSKIIYQNVIDTLFIEPGSSVSFIANETTTVNQLIAFGTQDQPIRLQSNTPDVAATLLQAANAITADYLLVRDINATGGATFAVINGTNFGNSPGWSFSIAYTPRNFYWVNNSGNWSDFANHWATSSGGTTFHNSPPGINDNVFFDANSFTLADPIVTLDRAQVSCLNMDWTGSINSPTLFAADTVTMVMGGSLTFAPGMISDIRRINFNGLGTGLTVTSNGVPFGSRAILNFYSGEYSLTDPIETFVLNSQGGVFNSNGQTINTSQQVGLNFGGGTVMNLSNSSVTTRAFFVSAFSASLIAQNASINTVQWNNTGGNLTFHLQNSLIEVRPDSAITSLFYGNGTTYNNVRLLDSTFVYGSATYDSLFISPGTEITMEGGATHAFNYIEAQGNASETITLRSGNPGVQANISQSTGTASFAYTRFQDINATGGANFQTSNAVNLGNTSGFDFNASPIYLDSLALVDLYQATGGANWTRQANWLTGPIVTWEGILVENDRVVQIDLPNNNLQGVLPSSISSLSALRNFYVYFNPSLSGDLFTLLQNISTLERISAHDCQFTGSISPQIFTSNLREIRVFNNQFTGTIPPEIGNSPLLDQFHVALNQLTGELPAEIGALSELLILEVNNNQLSGPLPSGIYNLRKMYSLHLGENNFEGGLDVAVANWDSLSHFNIANNPLMTGPIPDEIASLEKLQYLILVGCNFTGTLTPEVWNMPSLLGINVGGNRNLAFALPTDWSNLTDMTEISLWNIKPIKGEFPSEVYNLTQLQFLDFGGQAMTGGLSAEIGNLTQLRAIYLYGNNLSGAVPQELTNLTNLEIFSIAGNRFTDIPDLTSLPNLTQLNIQNNFFDFSDIVPNAGIAGINYTPQRRPGQESDQQIALNSDITLTAPVEDLAGNVYQWIHNRDTLQGATDRQLTLTGITLSQLGEYGVYIQNPAAPALTLFGNYTYITQNNGPRSYVVSNRPGDFADFTHFGNAISSINAGDTLYVMGSDSVYSGARVRKGITILGPGYFLKENPKTQYDTLSAQATLGTINITSTASGFRMYGMEALQVIMNNGFFLESDTLRDVVIARNKVNSGIFLVSHGENIEIAQNYGSIYLYGADAEGIRRGEYAWYENVAIRNNISRFISSYFPTIPITAERNHLVDVSLSQNVIDTLRGINEVRISNSIVRLAQGDNVNWVHNVVAGDISGLGGTFTNNQTNIDLSSVLVSNLFDNPVDSAFVLAASSPALGAGENGFDAGAFSGNDPYVLSGLPPIPAIYSISNTDELVFRVQSKVNDPSFSHVNRLEYFVDIDGTASARRNYTNFTVANDVDIEFRPRLEGLAPNQEYDIIFQSVDENGRRSHPTRYRFFNTRFSLQGTARTADNNPVTQGTAYMLGIRLSGQSYDTVGVATLGNNGVYQFDNLIKRSHTLAVVPDTNANPDLLLTYLGNVQYWEEAESIFIDKDTTGIDVTVGSIPPPPTGTGAVLGYLEEETEDEAGRLLARRRISGAGVSLRKDAGQNRGQNEFELVAFTYTNENGEFDFKQLNTAIYRIDVQYPGVPMDQSSFIDIEVDENNESQIEVEAIVTETGIVVNKLRALGIPADAFRALVIYPNPAKETLHFRLEESSISAINIDIIDLHGRTVMHVQNWNPSERLQLDVSALQNGLYIVRVQVPEAGNTVQQAYRLQIQH